GLTLPRSALVRALAVADDDAGFHRPPLLVVNPLVGIALRPNLGEPGANAEGDAKLLDRIRIVIHVLVLPHARRDVKDVAGLPGNPLALHIGVALSFDSIDHRFEVLVTTAVVIGRLDPLMRD